MVYNKIWMAWFWLKKARNFSFQLNWKLSNINSLFQASARTFRFHSLQFDFEFSNFIFFLQTALFNFTFPLGRPRHGSISGRPRRSYRNLQFVVLGRPRPGPSGRPWKVYDFIFHDVSSLKYKHRFGFGRSFKVTIGGVTLNPNPYQAYQNVLRTWTAEILIPPL